MRLPTHERLPARYTWCDSPINRISTPATGHTPRHSFARDNLKAIWPNYAAVPHLRVVIPSVIADEHEREQPRAAVSGARFVVCELTAPEAVLKNRVTAREPNEYWRRRLRDFVDLYHRRTDLTRIRDFQVEAHGRSTDDAAMEVVEKAGWS